MTSKPNQAQQGGARLWLQINTAGAWRHEHAGMEGDEENMLATVNAMVWRLPHAKWCLLYSNGKRVYIHIDPQSGRAYLPDNPTTESRP